VNLPEAEFFQKYVNEPEPDFKWHYTGINFRTLSGGTAYVLNVTSLKWLDESVYTIEDGGTVWSHQVVVLVPKEVLYTNVTGIWQASVEWGCNKDDTIDGVNADIVMADTLSTEAAALAVVAF